MLCTLKEYFFKNLFSIVNRNLKREHKIKAFLFLMSFILAIFFFFFKFLPEDVNYLEKLIVRLYNEFLLHQNLYRNTIDIDIHGYIILIKGYALIQWLLNTEPHMKDLRANILIRPLLLCLPFENVFCFY